MSIIQLIIFLLIVYIISDLFFVYNEQFSIMGTIRRTNRQVKNTTKEIFDGYSKINSLVKNKIFGIK
tara:strand:- start:396 stop:596 length:201 start_codon:yes stop_codon:yes gene_type:complete